MYDPSRRRTVRHPAPRRLVVVFLLVAGLASACLPTPMGMAASDCLDNTPIRTLWGSYQTEWPTDGTVLADGTTIDARYATFMGGPANRYALVFRDVGGDTRSDLCMVGGRVVSGYDLWSTPWQAWHDTTALEVRTPAFSSIGLRVWNVGDGIAFTQQTTGGWRVVGAKMLHVHDDCIENDGMLAGLVDDSYLECYSAFSAQGYPGAAPNGWRNSFTVRNSLVYAKAMPTSYFNAEHGDGGPGHVGFFKWSNAPPTTGWSPKIVLQNVIFRVDEPPTYFGTVDIPPSYYDARDPVDVRRRWPIVCSNVTIVWTGSATYGPYPGFVDPSCGTVTTDIGVWDRAVATYLDEHP